MANHGTHEKTEAQRARHHAKASRAKRIARRWDGRVEEMRSALVERAIALAAQVEADHVEALAMNVALMQQVV